MRTRLLISGLLLCGAFVGCTRPVAREFSDDEILLSVGDSILRQHEVVAMIPVGLQKEDSAAMFEAIVRDWVQTQLLARTVGEEDPASIERIDRMTADYRRKLLLLQYIRNLESRGDGEVPESLVRDYYDAHPEEFRLERDIVKGIFLKINASSPRKDDIIKWMNAGDEVAVGKIERYGMNDALAYEYFPDRWVDVSSMPEMSPLRISGALTSPEPGRTYESQYGGMLYLLRVTDRVAAGEKMPYDFASARIREILRSGQRRESEAALMRTLAQRSIDNGKLKGGKYDVNKLINKK